MPVKVTSTPRKQFGVAALTLEGTSAKAVGAAMLAMKRSIVAGAPSHLRGVAKDTFATSFGGATGAKLSVRYDVKQFGDKTVGLIKAVGPWQLIEYDTKGHLIVSKKLGGTRKRRTGLDSGLFVRAAGKRITTTRSGTRGAVFTPQGFRAYARHPGTTGKRPWHRGIDRGTPAATLAYTAAIRADFKRQFG